MGVFLSFLFTAIVGSAIHYAGIYGYVLGSLAAISGMLIGIFIGATEHEQRSSQ